MARLIEGANLKADGYKGNPDVTFNLASHLYNGTDNHITRNINYINVTNKPTENVVGIYNVDFLHENNRIDRKPVYFVKDTEFYEIQNKNIVTTESLENRTELTNTEKGLINSLYDAEKNLTFEFGNITNGEVEVTATFGRDNEKTKFKVRLDHLDIPNYEKIYTDTPISERPLTDAEATKVDNLLKRNDTNSIITAIEKPNLAVNPLDDHESAIETTVRLNNGSSVTRSVILVYVDKNQTDKDIYTQDAIDNNSTVTDTLKDRIKKLYKDDSGVNNVTVGDTIADGKIKVTIGYEDGTEKVVYITPHHIDDFNGFTEYTLTPIPDTNTRDLTTDEANKLKEKLTNNPNVESYTIKTGIDNGVVKVDITLKDGTKKEIDIPYEYVDKQFNNHTIYTNTPITSNRELTQKEKDDIGNIKANYSSIKTLVPDNSLTKLDTGVINPNNDAKVSVTITFKNGDTLVKDVELAYIDNNTDNIAIFTDEVTTDGRELTDTEKSKIRDKVRGLNGVSDNGNVADDNIPFKTTKLNNGNVIVTVPFVDGSTRDITINLIHVDRNVGLLDIYTSEPVDSNRAATDKEKKAIEDYVNSKIAEQNTSVKRLVSINDNTSGNRLGYTVELIDGTTVTTNARLNYLNKDFSGKKIFTTTPITDNRELTNLEKTLIGGLTNSSIKTVEPISNEVVKTGNGKGTVKVRVTYIDGSTEEKEVEVNYIDKETGFVEVTTTTPLDDASRGTEDGKFLITDAEKQDIINKALTIQGVTSADVWNNKIVDGASEFKVTFADGTTKLIVGKLVYVDVNGLITVATKTKVEPNRAVTDTEKADIRNKVLEKFDNITSVTVPDSLDENGKVNVTIVTKDKTYTVVVSLDDTNTEFFRGPVEIDNPVDEDREITRDDKETIGITLMTKNKDIRLIEFSDIIKHVEKNLGKLKVSVTFKNGVKKTEDNFLVTYKSTKSDADLATNSNADVDKNGNTDLATKSDADNYGKSNTGNGSNTGSGSRLGSGSHTGNVRFNTFDTNKGPGLKINNSNSNQGGNNTHQEPSRLKEVKVFTPVSESIAPKDLLENLVVRDGYTISDLDIIDKNDEKLVVKVKYTDGFVEVIDATLGYNTNTGNNQGKPSTDTNADNTNNNSNNSNRNKVPKTGDNTNAGGYLGGLLAGIVSLLGVIVKKKDDENSNLND